jgi:hypothetical protein
MKKNTLTLLTALVLTLSSVCWAQEPKTDGGRPGPTNENANDTGSNSGDDSRYIGDGAYVYDSQTGLYVLNPSFLPPVNTPDNSDSSGGSDTSTTGGCDPITQGWENALNAAAPTVAIGGDQGIKMENAYQDTQTLNTTLIGGGLSNTSQTE